MKFVTRSAAIVFCAMMSMNLSVAQWIGSGGPFSITDHTLIVSGTTVYAGANTGSLNNRSGIYVSKDYGETWEQAGAGLASHRIVALARSGGKLLAATEGEGVYVTDNDGKNWTTSSLTNPWITAFACSGSTVFAGGMGLYRSADNGTNWMDLSSALPNVGITALALSGTYIYAATTGGVYRSSSSGALWTKTSVTGSTLTVSGSTVIVGTDECEGLFRSTDNGTTWTKIGLVGRYFNDLVVMDAYIFAATDNGVYRAAINDTVWTPMNTGLTFRGRRDIQSSSVARLAVAGTTLLAWTYTGGIFCSVDHGTTWTNHGMTTSEVNCLAAMGENVLAGTFDGIYRSVDHGVAWSTADSGTGYQVLSNYPLSGCTAFAVSGQDVYAGITPNGIFSSNDGGLTWTGVNSGLPVNRSFEIEAMAVSGTTLIAATHNGVFRSTDKGTSWTEIDSGLTTSPQIGFAAPFSSLVVSGTDLFLSSIVGGVYRSSNNGNSWEAVNTGLPPSLSVQALVLCGSDLFAAVPPYGVFKSTDRGNSWTIAGLTTSKSIGALAVSDLVLFAGTEDGIRYSSDRGVSWLDAGLPRMEVSALMVSGKTLLAGTINGGLWKRPLSEILTSVESKSTSNPTAFSLAQNYPNPFNPSTTISFTIPSKSRVSLKIFDVMGREVSTLASEEMLAGNYSRQWNASNMSSGMYFYRLQAGSYTETKRLVLVK